MKKGISFLLSILLVASGTVFGVAESQASMEFTGEEIKMSLDDVTKIMLTSSTAIETARLNEKANKAKTQKYYENVNNLEKLRNASTEARQAGMVWGIDSPSKTARELASVASSFAAAQTANNYDAEVNQIVRDTVEKYYQIVQAKEALRISQENAAIQETLYQNTLSKFNLGVVAKQDVLKAEIGLNEAKVNASKAEDMYKLAQMSFNMLLGMDLMQKVSLTDTLTEAEMSQVPLGEAIEKALENRNEITGAAFGVKVQELTVKETGNNVSRSSAAYQTEMATLLNVQDKSKNAPKGIELDVRNKYMTMVQKKAEVEQGKMNVDNAKETYRLANLQYDAGMATLTDTQQAQLGAYQTELAYYVTLLEYNLAIIDYEQAMTVGTVSIPF